MIYLDTLRLGRRRIALTRFTVDDRPYGRFGRGIETRMHQKYDQDNAPEI